MSIALYHCPQRFHFHPLVTCSLSYIPGENLCLQCFCGPFSAEEKEIFGEGEEVDFLKLFF